MSDISRVYFLETGEVKEIPEMITFSNKSEYPQQWFQKNPGKKPSLIVPKIKDPNGVLGRAVLQLLKTRKLSSIMVRAYLYQQLKGVSEICPDDWTSFGIQIGRKGTRVHMFDMLDITEEDYDPGVLEGTDEPQHKVLIGTILFICKIVFLEGSIHDNVKALDFQKRFAEVYGTDPVVSLAQCPFDFALKSDRELMKMIAAIDMFLHRFPTSPVSRYRLGTKISRYYGCAALKLMDYLLKEKGFKNSADLLQWVWLDMLAEEIKEIYRVDMAENENPHSYFPYFMFFGLSHKSPYSVSSNPGLQTFCQVIKIASGDMSAANACMVMAYLPNQIVENALRVAYALYSTEERKVTGETTQKFVDPEEPKSMNAVDWFLFFKKGGSKGENMKAFKRAILEKIKETRKGTVGEYLKNACFSVKN